MVQPFCRAHGRDKHTQSHTQKKNTLRRDICSSIRIYALHTCDAAYKRLNVEKNDEV